MDNQQFNHQKRQSIRLAIESGFVMNSELRRWRAESDKKVGSTFADKMDAIGFRLDRYGDMQADIQELSESVVSMSPRRQMVAIAEIKAMVDTYKAVFEDLKADFGYKGTFEQYIEDVLTVAESIGSDASMEQIGKRVLTSFRRR